MDLPAPLEWHPAYRDRSWLLDWLNGHGEFAHLNDLRIPNMRKVRLADYDDAAPEVPMPHLVLSKQRAFGRAPYVGDPFIYVWNIATDNLGQSIAGESTIQYVEVG